MSPSSDFQTAPPTLYKYRRFDTAGRHIRLVSHGELWFASAKDFNDPFDTSFRYNFDGFDGELAERWVQVAAKRQSGAELSPEEIRRLALSRLAELHDDPEAIPRIQEYQIESNYKAWGICSLCTARDNLLLWAHYSQDHSGFCVGISMDVLDAISKQLVPNKLVLDLQKVRYSSIVPDPNFFEKMLDLSDTSYIRDFIGTKSTDWSYEEEYRLVFYERINFVFPLPPPAISEVILGCRISAENRELVLRACQTYAPQAQVYQARKENTRFALAIEPISL